VQDAAGSIESDALERVIEPLLGPKYPNAACSPHSNALRGFQSLSDARSKAWTWATSTACDRSRQPGAAAAERGADGAARQRRDERSRAKATPRDAALESATPLPRLVARRG
jgi:hypothetical protein